jgi:hypothetical protein
VTQCMAVCAHASGQSRTGVGTSSFTGTFCSHMPGLLTSFQSGPALLPRVFVGSKSLIKKDFRDQCPLHLSVGLKRRSHI